MDANSTITVYANARQRLFLMVHLINQPSPDQADRDAKRAMLARFDLLEAADDLAFQGSNAQGEMSVERKRWNGRDLKPYFLAPADAATLERVLAVSVPGAFGYQLGALGAALADGRKVQEQSRPAAAVPPIDLDRVPLLVDGIPAP